MCDMHAIKQPWGYIISYLYRDKMDLIINSSGFTVLTFKKIIIIKKQSSWRVGGGRTSKRRGGRRRRGSSKRGRDIEEGDRRRGWRRRGGRRRGGGTSKMGGGVGSKMSISLIIMCIQYCSCHTYEYIPIYIFTIYLSIYMYIPILQLLIGP